MRSPRLAAALAATALLLAACVGVRAPGSHHGPVPVAEPTFPVRAGERVRTLAMHGAYRPRAPHGGTDDYRCFLLDPLLDRAAFLTGIGFRPGNRAVVHHAVLFRVPPDRVAAAEKLDARTPGDGWTCFGGTEIPAGRGGDRSGNDGWLDAWAPGGKPVTYPDGLGVPLPARSRVVLQVHYNLLAGDQPDRTAVTLRLAAARPGIRALGTALVPAPVELPCRPDEAGPLCSRPAAIRDVAARFGPEIGGSAAELQKFCGTGRPRPGPTQHCDIRVPVTMTVWAAAGHMHLLGRSIRLTLDPGTPRERVILDVPVYDFDNQGARPLAQPIQLRKGHTVRVTCTHDARLRQLLPALAHQPPRYVVWGDGTSDEMCLGILEVTRG